ncbi:hypothetical protein C8F01DRAFT_1110406 [Mycena amicta]|nr:hypothetical protein C8F01DRAFT_1110406 [Mycena amicta]
MFPYQTNPRDKYLAALANVKAAEAEYLAAERLQQEEDALRHRLQQIQALKQPVYPTRYDDLPQIAAEERQRILHRQQEVESNSRELELELRKARAQAAERERALAAQQAKLAALVQRSSQPDYAAVDDDFTDILRVLGVQPAAVSKAKPTVTLEHNNNNPAPAAAPAEPTAVTLEQFLGNIFGVERQKQDEPKKAAAPTPPSTCCKPAPAPTAQNPQVGPEQLLEPLLLNLFLGGQPQPQQAQAESSKASSSQSTETKLKHDLETRLDTRQAKEDQDLAEAIRMSLADLDAANTSTDSKGKAPAPAPVNNVATSVAEIKAIEDSFTPDSLMSRLTHSAHNQPLRYYHQALSKLLTRLDAVESFGDEEYVVEKVEGALDEVESVVEDPLAQDLWAAPAAVLEDNVTLPNLPCRPPIVDEPGLPYSFLPDESTETIRPYDVDAPASPVESERPVESKKELRGELDA